MRTPNKFSDPDLRFELASYSKLPSKMNRFNMYCSVCHGAYFVDEQFYAHITRLMEDGFENPFVCDECKEDADELEHDRDHQA